MSNYCTGFKNIATDTTLHTFSERMNVHEALSYLESAFGTDNEIPDNDALSFKVGIQPPGDPSCCSDSDSGDKENADPSRLSRHQLLAPVTVEIVNPIGPVIIGENETCQTISINKFSVRSTESTSSRKKKQNIAVVGERKIWGRTKWSGSGKAVLLL